MNILENLQSQKLIYQAQIQALDRMRDASMWAMMIMLKAGLVEIERQIDELLGAGDIL